MWNLDLIYYYTCIIYKNNIAYQTLPFSDQRLSGVLKDDVVCVIVQD